MIFLILLVFYSTQAFSSNICDFFINKDCKSWFGTGGRSTSPSVSRGISFPNASSVFSLSPARLNIDRGFGLESVHYRGNYSLGIATGTGVVGGGFASTTTEGLFFGNSSKESIRDYEARKVGRRKIKEKKYVFATSVSLINLIYKKKGNRKRNYWRPQVNLGIIANYNEETKKYGDGMGAAFVLGPLTISGARFSDTYLNPINNHDTVSFYVNTFSLGARILNIAVEYTEINNKDSFEDKISLSTATLYTNLFMFTYGLRKEESRYFAYDYENKQFTSEINKEENFAGIQFPIGSYFLLGFFYNYYLNRNGSVSLSGFF